MRLLKEFRIFADYYQFFIHDSSADPCPESFYSEPDDQRSDFGSYEQGYITNGKTICFCTCAHLNVHWIEVYFSVQSPDLSEAERVIALPLQVSSSKISVNDISSSEPLHEIEITPGQYTVYFLAFNLGSEQLFRKGVPRPERNSDELSDEQLRNSWEFERYKIVFVPGRQDKSGVVHGTDLLRPQAPTK